MTKNEVIVKGINVRYQKVNQEEYICLTDIAKTRNPLEPKDVIKSWMRSRSTLEYLAMWENFYNPDFKEDGIDPLLAETSKHSFTMSQTRWVDEFNAIGMFTKASRTGGTYAHQDIAFKFASWLSAEFEFYLIKEFQRLKTQEQKELEWSAKRELAKVIVFTRTQLRKISFQH